MILEIDMGNTRIKWRLRRDSSNVARGSLQNNVEFDALLKTLAPYGVQAIRRVLVASVVSPVRNEMLADWIKKNFRIMPEFARSQLMCGGVENGYSMPERLGVDRWLAILAGHERAQGACVIVDCGTAITVDLVNAEGVHQGGYIAPGLTMMRSALVANTFAIGADDGVTLNTAPGRDTESAISGALAAMTKGLIQQAVQQLAVRDKCSLAPVLYITGGDAERLTQIFPSASIVPDLVFDGLGLAFSAA